MEDTKKWRIFYRLDGDILVEAETEQEARRKFFVTDWKTLIGNVDTDCPEIDDLTCESEN